MNFIIYIHFDKLLDREMFKIYLLLENKIRVLFRPSYL